MKRSLTSTSSYQAICSKKRKPRYSNASTELLHDLSSVKACEYFPNTEASQKQNGGYVYAHAAVSGRSEQAARKSNCSDSSGASEVHAHLKE